MKKISMIIAILSLSLISSFGQTTENQVSTNDSILTGQVNTFQIVNKSGTNLSIKIKEKDGKYCQILLAANDSLEILPCSLWLSPKGTASVKISFMDAVTMRNIYAPASVTPIGSWKITYEYLILLPKIAINA